MKLYCGDSLSLLRTLPSDSVDAIVTDPPYCSGGQYRGDRSGTTRKKYVQTETKLFRGEFAGDNRDQRSYVLWCTLWLLECLRIAREGSAILLFADWRQLPATSDALQAGGWVWRGIVPWDKGRSARPQFGRFRAQCEYVLWGSKGPFGQNDGGACLDGLYAHRVLQSDKHHTAGKPTALMRDLLEITPEGCTVLDPFMGSGTTGVAAIETGRDFVGIEVLPEFVSVARRRIAQARPLEESRLCS